MLHGNSLGGAKMNGINKTISLQKKVTITTDDLKEIDLAFLSCQIGTEYNTFGINIQIILIIASATFPVKLFA